MQSAGFQALSSLSLSVRVDSVMTVHMSDGDHFSGLIEDDKSAITTVHGNGGFLSFISFLSDTFHQFLHMVDGQACQFGNLHECHPGLQQLYSNFCLTFCLTFCSSLSSSLGLAFCYPF